jgi:hypothetical protein
VNQPISLYLDLNPDALPDLATVARAALAFDAAIKELSFVLDPGINIQVELDSGTKGSLKLNAILRTVKDKVTDKKTLIAIATAVITWLAHDVRSYLTEQAIEEVISKDVGAHLSPEEIKQIADQVAKALKGRTGERAIREIYNELERDPAVKGVGATTNPDKKPRVIVPRDEFKTRGGSMISVDPQNETRTDTTDETLTLISPVLLDANRKWKFSLNGFEFGAQVKDHQFLDEMLSGLHPVPMVSGIRMDVEMDTKLEKIGGVWAIKDRTVTKVRRAYAAGVQDRLPLDPPQQDGNS